MAQERLRDAGRIDRKAGRQIGAGKFRDSVAGVNAVEGPRRRNSCLPKTRFRLQKRRGAAGAVVLRPGALAVLYRFRQGNRGSGAASALVCAGGEDAAAAAPRNVGASFRRCGRRCGASAKAYRSARAQ